MVSGVRLVPLVALIAGLAACGDAFSSQLPEKKQVAGLMLRPNHGEIGESVPLQAVITVPHGLNYISQYDFGDGLDVLYFETGAGLGCEDVDLSQFELSAEEGHFFAVCLTVVLQESAPLGEREVSIDVESDGTPVIGRGSFWVLPELVE